MLQLEQISATCNLRTVVDCWRSKFTDFRLFTSVIQDLADGVFINAVSSLILPEVFLKALRIAQNVGAGLHDFTTINIDMLMHYRAMVNVVHCPTTIGRRGFMLSGRHELLIPLIAFALLDTLNDRDDRASGADSPLKHTEPDFSRVSNGLNDILRQGNVALA